MILKSVDLPQPEGPMMPTNSAGATDSETPSTAMTAPSGVSNRLVMLSTARIAPALAAAGPGCTAADSTVETAITLLVPCGLTAGLARAYSTSQVARRPLVRLGRPRLVDPS